MDYIRQSQISGLEEVSDLEMGMDFRLPQYRREVFLRLYEFHLKYRSHPGAVYYIIPYLIKEFNLDREQQYWLVYLNGCTQNICTTWVVFNVFPDFHKITFDKFEKWHRKYWKRLNFDLDRRYIKGHLVELWQNYKSNLGGLTQEQFFEQGLAYEKDPFSNFYRVWGKVMKDFHRFGRLSTYSYLEYLKIIGLNIDCPELFLEDLSGSKSHRNGILKVCGRDDLDWHKSNPSIVTHNSSIVEFAIQEGVNLLSEAKSRFIGKGFYHDVNYFTLESTLCCYKSHFRINRRYPNVYNDMFFERIKKSEASGWQDHGIDFDIFWEARKELLPEYLRVEDNQDDPTFKKGNLHPEKQNHFRLTGQMIMLDKEWDCFKNDFNDKYYG